MVSENGKTSLPRLPESDRRGEVWGAFLIETELFRGAESRSLRATRLGFFNQILYFPTQTVPRPFSGTVLGGS